MAVTNIEVSFSDDESGEVSFLVDGEEGALDWRIDSYGEVAVDVEEAIWAGLDESDRFEVESAIESAISELDDELEVEA